MIDLKGLLTKILERLVVTNISLSFKNCTTGSYTRCYQMGKLVVLSFNINVTTAITSGDYIFDLPVPIGGGWGTNSSITGAYGVRWWVTTDGTLRADGAMNTGWHSGNVVYICQ
jgi:hypothetical protein